MPNLVASITLEADRLELGPQLPVNIPGFDYHPPALIDTGAAMSLIDVDLAQRWYTPTTDLLHIGGVGQGDEQPTFDIDVHIPDLNRYVPKPVRRFPYSSGQSGRDYVRVRRGSFAYRMPTSLRFSVTAAASGWSS